MEYNCVLFFPSRNRRRDHNSDENIIIKKVFQASYSSFNIKFNHIFSLRKPTKDILFYM